MGKTKHMTNQISCKPQLLLCKHPLTHKCMLMCFTQTIAEDQPLPQPLYVADSPCKLIKIHGCTSHAVQQSAQSTVRVWLRKCWWVDTSVLLPCQKQHATATGWLCRSVGDRQVVMLDRCNSRCSYHSICYHSKAYAISIWYYLATQHCVVP